MNKNWLKLTTQGAQTLTYSDSVYGIGITIIVTVVLETTSIATSNNVDASKPSPAEINAILHGCLQTINVRCYEYKFKASSPISFFNISWKKKPNLGKDMWSIHSFPIIIRAPALKLNNLN